MLGKREAAEIKLLHGATWHAQHAQHEHKLVLPFDSRSSSMAVALRILFIVSCHATMACATT